MDIVIEEDLMVDAIPDAPNSRRKNKKLPVPGNVQETSSQMEALKAIILNDAEMQAAKIAFIKEAIAEGRYTIHCEKIAEKMLADTPA